MKYQKANHQKRSGKPLRMAMIGPALYPETGTSVPFKILLDRMLSYGVTIHTIPIPIGNTGIVSKLLKFLGVLAKTMRVAPHVDVISAHVPTLQLANIAFAVLIVAKIFQRVFVLRKFGGTELSDLRRPARLLAEHVMKRSDVSFVEANKQCEDTQKRLSTEIFWYPNYRYTRELRPRHHRMVTRFVYLGCVRGEKGIGEIIEAATSLGGRCSVDVYGPCERRFNQAMFSRSAYVHYRGVLENSNIPFILSKYDALLLPTYWHGEGYPGVIIEAFQAGLPVIATRWKFIAEMVDETCGILVEPGDAEDLTLAMDRLVSDKELVQRLQMGALSKSKAFSVDRWADLFVRACRIAYENSGNKAETQRQIRVLYAQAKDDVSGSPVTSSASAQARCENTCL